MKWHIAPGTIGGTAAVPGDKSIAHRALMLAALAPGASTLNGLPGGEDVLSTARCLRALGVSIEIASGSARVGGNASLSEPDNPLDSGNSGTTMRLLAGILAGQPYASRLTGDASLSRRPMGRVVEPLQMMGAVIRARNGKPPLSIEGAPLRGIHYPLPIPSAQVKSAVLLASLFALGETTVVERIPTRDHTERLLAATGVRIDRADGVICIKGGQCPSPFRMQLPGDVSSAAFLFAATALTGGEVTVRDVGTNPTRTAFFDVLQRMGTGVNVAGLREDMGEPVGDVTITGTVSRPIHIDGEQVAPLIDELPLVALLATRARGTTVVRDAAELRVKETDRIAAVVESLTALGADITELSDGFVVRGPTPLRGSGVHSYGDHRLALLLAVAGAAASGETIVDGAEAAVVSFPQFESVFKQLGGNLHGS